MGAVKNTGSQAPEVKKQKTPDGQKTKDLSSHNSPSTACIQFFGIPELVEMTLLHVPALQLLPIQRTSKLFRDTIKSSILIQRKLFFKLDPHKNGIHQIEANPFLKKFGTGWSHATPRIFGHICTTNLEKYAQPTASWRKMLVSMPTGKRLIISRINTAIGWGQTTALVASEGGGGVRMWQVADHEWEDEGDLSTLIQSEVEM